MNSQLAAARRRLSIAASLAAVALLLAAGCGRQPEKERVKEKDPLALSMPAKADTSTRADERPGPAAVRPGTTAPVARDDDEPSIDDEPAPTAAPNNQRRVASAGNPSRRRRAQSGPRPGHGSEPSSEEPTLDDAAPAAVDLKVTRFVVARGVSGREPVGAAQSFSAESVDKLYAFVELTNEAKAESEIFVTFTPASGGVGHRIKLDVGAEKRWRTWARSNKPRTPGQWTATVRDGDGKVLARTSFEVTP